MTFSFSPYVFIGVGIFIVLIVFILWTKTKIFMIFEFYWSSHSGIYSLIFSSSTFMDFFHLYIWLIQDYLVIINNVNSYIVIFW